MAKTVMKQVIMTATITITTCDFIIELFLNFETTMMKSGMKEMN